MDDDERLKRNEELLGLIKKLDLNDPTENWVGPYAMVRTLGKGATGTVKQAFQRDAPEVEVAIKIVEKSFIANNPDERRRIEREIRVLKRIDHPYVMSLIDVIETRTHKYLVLEYLPGGELYDNILKQGGKLPLDEVFKIFFQLVMAVAHLHHHNIVHRDIKMENLLMDHKNDVKLADCGMACEVIRGVKLEERVGSPHYACPEIIKGEKYDGYAADVWSIGVVLYGLLTGTLPFAAESVAIMYDKIKKAQFRMPTELPDSAQDLLRGLLNTSPEQRFTVFDIQSHPWWKSRCGKITPSMRKIWEAEFPPDDVTDVHKRLLPPELAAGSRLSTLSPPRK